MNCSAWPEDSGHLCLVKEMGYGGFIGRSITALIENRREKGTGLLTGLADNYIRVKVEGGEELMNRLVRVRVVSLHNKGVLGEVLSR